MGNFVSQRLKDGVTVSDSTERLGNEAHNWGIRMIDGELYEDGFLGLCDIAQRYGPSGKMQVDDIKRIEEMVIVPYSEAGDDVCQRTVRYVLRKYKMSDEARARLQETFAAWTEMGFWREDKSASQKLFPRRQAGTKSQLSLKAGGSGRQWDQRSRKSVITRGKEGTKKRRN